MHEKQSTLDMKLECHKCEKTFLSLKDIKQHKHQEEICLSSRRQDLKSKNDNVSEDFIHSIQEHGGKYNFNIFQKAFFTENEMDASLKPCRVRRKENISNVSLNDNVSDDFKHLAEEQGITYNIGAFQKAFKYSDIEMEAKSRKTTRNEIPQSPPDESPRKRRKISINEDFVEALRNDGIEYNLAVFQRAFGCMETSNDVCQTKDKNDLNSHIVESKGAFECEQCQNKFTSRKTLIRHNKTHVQKDRNLYCEMCSKSFKTTACVQIHLATNHGRNDGPFDCPICFKSYQDRSALRSHFYIHSSERNFLCGR